MKLRKAIADSEGGLVFDAEGLTVADYLQNWLEGSVKGSVWHTTYRDYAGHVKNHIVPELGRLKLANLTATHVQALYRKMLDSSLAPRTVQDIHVTLHKALDQAVKWRLISYNASDAVTKLRQQKKREGCAHSAAGLGLLRSSQRGPLRGPLRARRLHWDASR